ncbi:alpha/beta hydrolase [Streptomyces sp. NPDC046203]|uniref:alpha/beta hydrolase n=1 Tax=Streptomyces sp. NPDC046203 TaxID=3154602 RepID=UPI0033C0F9EF
MSTAGPALTWRLLRDLRLTELAEAGDGWQQLSHRAGTDRGRVDRAMTARLRETQAGESAEAALGRLRRLSRNFHYLHTECGLVRSTLDALAADLAEPQRRLQDALRDAEERGFTVHEDGSVAYPAAPADSPVPGVGDTTAPGGTARGSLPLDPRRLAEAARHPLPFASANPHAARAQDIADRIADAVTTAASLDATFARTLDGLRAAEGLDVTGKTWEDVARDTADVRSAVGHHLVAAVPVDKSPADRLAWWEGLTDEQRREYLDIAPDLIGDVDGIPAAVRDEANRRYLPLLIEEMEEEGGQESKIEALRMIQDRLDEPSEPPMFLLDVDDKGNGRAIVSYGDPDTSRNVSAYVPGLGTKLDADFVTDTMKRAQDTAIGARRLDPSSAAIVWLGYEAPNAATVLSTGNATAGAPAYRAFMEGLDATNKNADPHLTAIGHSYGSLTVGTAARQSGGIPGVDEVILLGSPGVGVDRAEDLGVGREHVFVGSAENDPVTHLPTPVEFALGAVMTAGPVGALQASRVTDHLYFGRDPAAAGFGAQRFEVDDGPRMVADLGGFDAHSQYFTPELDRQSANNISRIVVGRPDQITREAYR